MDYFSLILVIYFSYRNGLRAKQKEQKPMVWGLITGVSIFCLEMVGAAVVIFYFCQDVINVGRLSDPAYKDTAVAQLTQAFANNPLHRITVDLFGIGGYLLVRYILDKKPDKKQPEIHWMDKMGNNENV
jgi:hypothetical protein